MEGGRGAVLVGSSACPGTAVQAFLTASSLHLSQVELACASTAPTSHSPRELDAVLLACAPGQLSTARDSLKYASRLLKPSAQLFLAFGDNTLEEAKKELLLAGFLNAELVDGAGLVKAVKPTWELGAKAALSIKRPAPAALAAQPATMPAAAPTASKAWVLTAQDDDELLDEDSLLTEEDKLRPAAAPAGTDCSTSKKACKNCSCGRADAEAAGEAVVLTQAMLDNPQTNCGSCALGDAFRCAGCPYRGLPMFEPGKKITLTSDFLTADAQL